MDDDKDQLSEQLNQSLEKIFGSSIGRAGAF